MARELHLNVNILNAGFIGGAWRFPGADPYAAYTAELYEHVVRKAEEARLDAVFFADTPALAGDLPFRPGNNFEPTVNLARLAAHSERIGLVGTLSASYNDPVEVARRIGSLDVISGGRVGLNVVTTAGPFAARNFGRTEEFDHTQRYERAADFARRLIDRWDAPDAVRSPQGRPVLLQAGGSRDGRRLASRIAEAVFSVDQTLAGAQAFRTEVRAGTRQFGRQPDDVILLPGLTTIVGSTEAEAKQRRELLDEIQPTGYALWRLGGQLGLDLERFELDEPIPRELLPEPEQASGSQGFYREVLGIIDREKPTLRELVRRLGGSTGHRIVVGGPEQIADDIQHWFEQGAADGFNLMPDVFPGGFDDFADHVVPELQRRGLFRRDYQGTTLREHFGLAVPPRGSFSTTNLKAAG
ncbi:LLM class flavin-dependent oxidoreductase [Frankia tisae]|uniref:LLM class flavin-dependent oxidoreductase n=1 Tax=Frankia tisae TaxID=2950104 RepID=UPI0021BFDF99|nr:LLM class flavin-dependent oxidoreductase [Frankia tisae]